MTAAVGVRKMAYRTAFAITVVCMAALFLARAFVGALFGGSPDAGREVAAYLPLFLATMLFLAFVRVTTSCFYATEKTGLSYALVFAEPGFQLVLFLTLPIALGLFGVWLVVPFSQMLAWFVSFCICQGRNDHESSHKSVGNGIAVTVLCSLALTVLFAAFSEQILWGFGATEKNIPYARDYFKYIIPGMPCYMFQNSMNAIIRADGSPRFAMMATVSGCIANMILDPVAIFVLDMGVAGAAIATVIGQFLGAVITVWYILHTKTFCLRRSSFCLRGICWEKSCPLGSAAF